MIRPFENQTKKSEKVECLDFRCSVFSWLLYLIINRIWKTKIVSTDYFDQCHEKNLQGTIKNGLEGLSLDIKLSERLLDFYIV